MGARVVERARHPLPRGPPTCLAARTGGGKCRTWHLFRRQRLKVICTGGAVGGEEAGEGARGHIAATEWPPGAPRRSAGARRPPTSDGTWGTRVTAHEEPTRRIQATAHTGPCPCTHGNGTHGPGRCSMSARSNECTSVSPPQASGPAGTRGRARAEGAHLFPRRRRLALRKPTSRVTRRQRASTIGNQERQTESTPHTYWLRPGRAVPAPGPGPTRGRRTWAARP